MASIALFHSVLGVRPGVLDAAARLRAAGHEVLVGDQYGGRVFDDYGDDSVAQLGGAHIACEWTSNVLTKILQRPRLGAYLEQSTRYIAYDAPMEGTSQYRYFRDEALGPEYEQAMDALFATYSAALPKVVAWVDSEFPGDPGPARTRAVISFGSNGLTR